jgi:hypothetical protein
LIGFGIAGFADLQGNITDDAGGDAVVTLGLGMTITLVGPLKPWRQWDNHGGRQDTEQFKI